MAWTTPRTWVAGEIVTAAIMNPHVRDNLNLLKTSINDDGTLKLSSAIAAKSALYTMTDTDGTILANGTFTVTLPSAVSRTGRCFVVKNVGTGTITVGSAGGNIDGSATFTLGGQYDSITVQSDGSNWWII